MARDPLDTLARLREIDLRSARRHLLDAQAGARAAGDAAAAAEAALRAETPDLSPATYGAFLARGLAERQALAAALARADATAEAGRAALAEAHRAGKILALLRDRRAAAARRDALRCDRLRLEDALPRA